MHGGSTVGELEVNLEAEHPVYPGSLGWRNILAPSSVISGRPFH